MNHPQAKTELTDISILGTRADRMLRDAFNDGWTRGLGITVEYCDSLGYEISDGR